MSRLRNFMARQEDQIAAVDLTGGVAGVTKLEDNGVPKVLLHLTRNGVDVEMRLMPDEAEDFHTEILEAIVWARNGGRRGTAVGE